MTTTKSGNRNNTDDRRRIREVRAKASEIHALTMEMEPEDSDAPDFVVIDAGQKSRSSINLAPALAEITAVKAAGEWELDVLGVPFGGPYNGKDYDRQFFSARTNLYLENYPTPLIVYYHGYEPDGSPSGEPEIIGKAISHEVKSDGVWWRVKLDKASEYAARVWESAKQGLARASSGSIAHLVRIARKTGEILTWPVAEISIFDAEGKRQPANPYAVAMPVMKSLYQQAGIDLPDTYREESEPEAEAKGDEQSATATQADETATKTDVSKHKEFVMDAEMQKLIDESVANAVKAQKAADAELAKAEADKQAAVDAAVKAAKEEWEKDAAKSRRLPTGVSVNTKGRKYDNYSLADMDFTAATIKGKVNGMGNMMKPSKELVEAINDRLDSKDSGDAEAIKGMKSHGAYKSDEVMQQDLTSYGDEWVGAGYGTELWRSIRNAGQVMSKLPQFEIPKGYETFYDPTEGADPTWYKVAEVTDNNSTTLIPNATVPSSKKATGRSNETLAKAGARVLYSGELDEDSLIQVAPALRESLVLSGQEMLEHIVIDGDTDATATTNINDIGGTPAATDFILLVNGFRKLALITNSANARSASGAFVAQDFLETVKLMGSAGANALDIAKVAFIVDANVHWASLELPEVKTRDVFAMPTLERGKLTGIYGYEVMTSPFMHFASTVRKANTAGKIDQDTVANNTTGAILAVRWDQWKFGWKRRMTIESTRIARADAWEITALMRFGLKYRDTEASAISYNVGI